MKRRTFLRGSLAGATFSLGLPLFEAMLNTNGQALANGQALPKRFVVWFWGNGSDKDRWSPATQGPGWEPGDMLQGLASVKDYVNLVTGTTLPVSKKNNPHVEGAVGILTGGNPLLDKAFSGSGGDWNYMTVPDPSVDVLVANEIGQGTQERMLTTAVTALHGVTAGAPGTAVRYISHQSAYTPNQPIYTPQELFTKLFSQGIPSFTPEGPTPAALAKAHVLDVVREDAKALHQRLGASDRRRLDQHLTGIGDLEKKLKSTPSAPPIGGACALMPQPDTVESYQARAKLFSDVIAMAFACDLSRVATIEFTSPASHVAYHDVHNGPLVFGGSSMSFHEYQHNAGRDAQVRKAQRYFVDNYARFLETLKSFSEGDATLLDHTLAIGTSEVSTGENHQMDDYPIIVGGRAHGALQYPGVHVRKDSSVSTTSVMYTCLRAMGVNLPSWGRDQFRVSEPVLEITGPNFV